MKSIIALLRPRILSAFNNLRPGNKKNIWVKLSVFGIVGLLFWAGAFMICYRILLYFQGVQDFGHILAMKLLSMVVMTFFALLIFSNIINSLSHLYLSRDLQLLHSMPVSAQDIFFSRWLISTFDSSWMVVLFSLPVFHIRGRYLFLPYCFSGNNIHVPDHFRSQQHFGIAGGENPAGGTDSNNFNHTWRDIGFDTCSGFTVNTAGATG